MILEATCELSVNGHRWGHTIFRVLGSTRVTVSPPVAAAKVDTRTQVVRGHSTDTVWRVSWESVRIGILARVLAYPIQSTYRLCPRGTG